MTALSLELLQRYQSQRDTAILSPQTKHVLTGTGKKPFLHRAWSTAVRAVLPRPLLIWKNTVWLLCARPLNLEGESGQRGAWGRPRGVYSGSATRAQPPWHTLAAYRVAPCAFSHPAVPTARPAERAAPTGTPPAFPRDTSGSLRPRPLPPAFWRHTTQHGSPWISRAEIRASFPQGHVTGSPMSSNPNDLPVTFFLPFLLP